jgi:UDP-N-acetylglucosamine:LPS N-acetylglucosamine transferase
MNIALVSIGDGNTLGHHSLIKRLSDNIITIANKLIVICESSYSFSFPKDKVEILKINKAKHVESFGGYINYPNNEEIFRCIITNKIDIVIFSTFYDVKLLISLRNANIKTILLSYPFRDTHEEILKLKGYDHYFDKVLYTEDVIPYKGEYNIVKIPLCNGISKNPIKRKKQILITKGGGGRPSSNIFKRIIESVLIEFLNDYIDYKVIYITGPFGSDISISHENLTVLKYTSSIHNLICESKLVISEAGYNTVQELIYCKTKAILIPGDRRIDNQELRAIHFEKKGYGLCHFPEEDVYALKDKIHNLMNGFMANKEILNQSNQPHVVDVIVKLLSK